MNWQSEPPKMPTHEQISEALLPPRLGPQARASNERARLEAEMLRPGPIVPMEVDYRDVALARGEALIDARSALLDVMAAGTLEQAKCIARIAFSKAKP
jgi:hypothetical protein